MSKVFPNLLYLTIYNPTLRPAGPVAPDDEDAEEQAHILFYTSKERAVSRDRMLRQVGLAKALISFSDMFNPDDSCNNVHSQTKRMIMVSPEPDFWIHAGIDVAKTPRPLVDKGKGKGKDKDKAKADTPLLYDYHEHSVHDGAVQADIMRGYEKFKLRHGSFASILSALGQEALELQLERFFTVWAWSWNLEDGPELGEHLGPPLHPMQPSLLDSIDDFASRLPEEVVAIAVSPPYVVPSTRYTEMSFPTALPNFLLSLLPPPQEALPPPPPAATDDSTIKAGKAQPPPESVVQRPSKGDDDAKSFLGMNLDVKMDMPKWSWPGYLTFGKSGKKPPDLFAVTPMNENKGAPALVLDTPGLDRTTDFEVDRSALEDAMFSERLPAPVEKTADAVDGKSISETIVPRKEDEDTVESGASDETTPLSEPLDADADDGSREPQPVIEPVEFSSTTIHLASSENPQATSRQRLFYLVVERVLVGLIWTNDSVQELPSSFAVSSFGQAASALAVSIDTAMKNHLKSMDTLPSANNILQPKDRFVLSSSQLTIRSADFESRSGHLYNAQELLHKSDPNISEVFSRGQNPQHWHVARRGLGIEDGTAEEEVYMQVFRKEASLTDVDNALAGVIRKSGQPATPPPNS